MAAGALQTLTFAILSSGFGGAGSVHSAASCIGPSRQKAPLRMTRLWGPYQLLDVNYAGRGACLDLRGARYYVLCEGVD